MNRTLVFRFVILVLVLLSVAPLSVAGSVPAAAANTMHIGDIQFSVALDPYGRTLARWFVLVHDEADNPLPQVSVDATITPPSSTPVQRTRLTHGTGWARFHWGHALAEPWLLCVDNLTLAGYSYEPGDNEVPYCGPLDDAILWYDFEGDFVGAGVVEDRSGNGHHALIDGTVEPAEGISGSQGIFFSQNGYLQAQSNPAAGRTNVSFSFWFKTDNPGENYKLASGAWWDWGPGSGWIMATHLPEFWSDDGQGLYLPGQPNNENNFLAGEWNHEAITYDGERIREYTNGQLINDWATTGAPIGQGELMVVGAWPPWSGYDYYGSMDEFRLYGRALSADEVQALYDQGHPGGPAVIYSTYLGGTGLDYALDTAIDTGDNVYIVGWTNSAEFPTTPGAYDTTYNGGEDAFLIKLSADGSTLLYGTYLGGSGREHGMGVALDGDGNIYVTGDTYSVDFPATPGAYDTTLGGGRDGFVAKLSADGSTLLYGTYLGGSNWDYGNCIAVDGAGSAYVGGFTHGSFPVTSGAAQTDFGGLGDGFVAKLSQDGGSLVYGTYLGGSAWEANSGIAVDDQGNVYTTSGTLANDFPTTPGAYDTVCESCLAGIGSDATATKLSADGSSFVYSTFVGGESAGGEDFYDVVVDSAGNAYLAGQSGANDFPTTQGAWQPAFHGGEYDAVVVKVNAEGNDLLYSTYLGGAGTDRAQGIVFDNEGNAYVAGVTASTDSPPPSPGSRPTQGGGTCSSPS